VNKRYRNRLNSIKGRQEAVNRTAWPAPGGLRAGRISIGRQHPGGADADATDQAGRLVPQ